MGSSQRETDWVRRVPTIKDWPVGGLENRLRVFRIYRQRRATEDSFRLTKQVLGSMNVKLLNLEVVHTLAAPLSFALV